MTSACPKTKACAMILAAAIFALGPIGAGVMIRQGLIEFRSADKFVSVKGLATREVEADLVLWNIKHSATGNDLPEVQKTVEGNTQKILGFLKAQGLSEADITGRRIEVTDLLAQSYRSEGASTSRYIVSDTVSVRSHNIDGVNKASQNVGDLLREGVSLVRGDQNGNGGGYPEYIYTKLNDIKPSMIAESTKNARESAEQFSNDSGARVGQIAEAYQGVFEILPRDSGGEYQERQERFKTVRVVSTIKFYLE